MNEALALEIFKSQMVIVVEGLKIMAYANGGAVVALLALLGSLAGRCTTVPHVTRAILCFVAGLVTSIMSFFLSYFKFVIFYNRLKILKKMINFAVLIFGKS